MDHSHGESSMEEINLFHFNDVTKVIIPTTTPCVHSHSDRHVARYLPALQSISSLVFPLQYHISDIDAVARFVYHLRSRRDESQNTITLFSGDVFSPSLEASILRGGHMVQLLKDLGIDVGCFGNHDFDFGEERLRELASQTGIPWVLSNGVRKHHPVVHTPEEGRISGVMKKGSSGSDDNDDWLLAGAKSYIVKEVSRFRIGLFGLAGSDWPSNCQHLPACEIIDPVLVARKLARYLRTVEHCDFVIALTHMRLAEDMNVAKSTDPTIVTLGGRGASAAAADEERVDLILGGHDHEVVRRYQHDANNDAGVIEESCRNADIVAEGRVRDVQGPVRIIKSGTDWKGLSGVKMVVSRDLEDGKARLMNLKVSQIVDMSKLPQPPRWLENHEPIVQSLNQVYAAMNKTVQQPLVHSVVALDGRGTIVRSQETNLGNMLADAVRAYYDTDIAFVNSGAMRCNRVIGPTSPKSGPLSVRDIIEISPFDNAFVVKRVTATSLLEALENSISDLHSDGRFLQMSGMRIEADWHMPQGQRVLSARLVSASHSAEEQIRRGDKIYSVAMVTFIAAGFDGYNCFKDEATVVSEEGAMTDTNLLLQVFQYEQQERRHQATRQAASDNTRDSGDEGVERARDAILSCADWIEGMPTVSPRVEGRIRFRSSFINEERQHGTWTEKQMAQSNL